MCDYNVISGLFIVIFSVSFTEHTDAMGRRGSLKFVPVA